MLTKRVVKSTEILKREETILIVHRETEDLS